MKTTHANCGAYSVWYYEEETVYVCPGAKLTLNHNIYNLSERDIMSRKFDEAIMEIQEPRNSYIAKAVRRGFSAYDAGVEFKKIKLKKAGK